MRPIRAWRCELHSARIAAQWWAASSLFPSPVARGAAARSRPCTRTDNPSPFGAWHLVSDSLFALSCPLLYFKSGHLEQPLNSGRNLYVTSLAWRGGLSEIDH